MDGLKETFVWICKEIIARLDEAESTRSTSLGDLASLLFELEDICPILYLSYSPLHWDRTPKDHKSDPKLVTVYHAIRCGDPKDCAECTLIYIQDEERDGGMPVGDPRGVVGPPRHSEIRSDIKLMMGRWIRYANRPDFGKPPQLKAPAAPVDESVARLPTPSDDTKMADGGALVFFEDRVELLGVVIVRGDRPKHSRQLLDLLRQQNDDRSFVSLDGKGLANGLGIKVGRVAGLVRDIRNRICDTLQRAGVKCNLMDLIEGGRGGYHLCKKLTVHDAAATSPRSPRAATEPGHEPNNAHDLGHDPSDLDPCSAAARQAWILEQIAARGKLCTSQIIAGLRVSISTIKRDLKSLRRLGKIRFDGNNRSGGYVLIQGQSAA